MKIKVSEASGIVLDWMVATCEERLEGTDVADFLAFWGTMGNSYGYSSNWAQGGPIIEREKIGVWWATHCIDGDGNEHGNHWYSEIDGNGDPEENYIEIGATQLEAAMRCYVASKLGEEVEVPDELVATNGASK